VSLGGKQVAFDAEVAAIEKAIRWFGKRGNLRSSTPTRRAPLLAQGIPEPGLARATHSPSTVWFHLSGGGATVVISPRYG
jgi:hypothetical protein